MTVSELHALSAHGLGTNGAHDPGRLRKVTSNENMVWRGVELRADKPADVELEEVLR
jgi:hypothetical protein